MTKKSQWEVEIVEDANGEMILPFPEDLLLQEGWQENDELEFITNKDNTFVLVNISKQKRMAGVENDSLSG